MNLDKKKSLWRRLRIKYEYHWMDREYFFKKVPALPTWFMLHNSKEIERRVAEFNAEMEQFRREQHELILRLRKLYDQAQKEAAEKRNSNRF